METTKYEFRRLEAKDIALMTSILSKIGIKELKGCFQNVDIQAMDKEVNTEVLGMSITFDAVGIILANYEKCQNDIFNFLASLTGMDKKQIEAMPLAEFAEILIELVKLEDFKDFFTVVSKLFK